MAISIENRGRLKIAVQSAEFSRASLIMPPSICRARLAITKMVGMARTKPYNPPRKPSQAVRLAYCCAT